MKYSIFSCKFQHTVILLLTTENMLPNMKRVILIVILMTITIGFLSSKNVVKLLLPVNCFTNSTYVGELNNSESILLELMPNPNDGSFSLRAQLEDEFQKVTITILNLLGQPIFNESVLSNFKRIEKQFYLNIPQGIYFVRIISGNDQSTKRLIVK